MKSILSLLFIFCSSHAFAGAYSLNCSNKAGTLTLEIGTFHYRDAGGFEINGSYFVDETYGKAPSLMGSDIADFLKSNESKALVRVQASEKIISHKKLKKDECGNAGYEERMIVPVRVTAPSGEEIITDKVICDYRQVTGHCI